VAAGSTQPASTKKYARAIFFLRDDLNGPGYYANIFDTVENRLVWEEEFKNDEDARIAMVCEHLMLASIASRTRHIQ
jgi:hypothetical protein